MSRSWGARNSTVGQLLQVERTGIEPLAADPKRVAAVLDADKEKQPRPANQMASPRLTLDTTEYEG